MKRVISVFAVVVLAVSLSGCTPAPSSEPRQINSEEEIFYSTWQAKLAFNREKTDEVVPRACDFLAAYDDAKDEVSANAVRDDLLSMFQSHNPGITPRKLGLALEAAVKYKCPSNNRLAAVSKLFPESDIKY